MNNNNILIAIERDNNLTLAESYKAARNRKAELYHLCEAARLHALTEKADALSFVQTDLLIQQSFLN